MISLCVDDTNLFVLKLPLYHTGVNQPHWSSPYFPLLLLPEPLPPGISTFQLPHSNPSYNLLQESPSLYSLASCSSRTPNLWALKCFCDNIPSSLPIFSVLHDLIPASNLPPSTNLMPHSIVPCRCLSSRSRHSPSNSSSRSTSNRMFKPYHLPWPFQFTVTFLTPLNT